MKKKVIIIASSVVLCVVIVLGTLFALGIFGSNVAKNTEHLTKVTSTFKLSKSYEGKSFLHDGIGKATVDAYVDGDTTRFKLEKDNMIVSVRYYQVNTPESTGDVEKWGKAASLFTKGQLSKAVEIVLEATASKAVHDNYGVRYLGYVWYKTNASEDFKCLNLELVENGYTDNNGVFTSAFPYNAYFDKATKNAQSIKLRKYSDLDDPLYSTEPIDVKLQDLVAELTKNPDINEFYQKDTESGSKVRFNACLTELKISNSGTYTYKAQCFDENTGEELGSIDVYAAYSSSASSTMKLGHYYRIVGTVQFYFDKYQISGITYNLLYGEKRMDYTHPIQKNYLLTFDNSAIYSEQMNQTYYTDATVVNASVDTDGTTLLVTAVANKRKGINPDSTIKLGEDETFTFKIINGASKLNKFTTGIKFSAKGFQFKDKSGIITIFDCNSVVTKY